MVASPQGCVLGCAVGHFKALFFTEQPVSEGRLLRAEVLVVKDLGYEL